MHLSVCYKAAGKIYPKMDLVLMVVHQILSPLNQKKKNNENNRLKYFAETKKSIHFSFANTFTSPAN